MSLSDNDMEVDNTDESTSKKTNRKLDHMHNLLQSLQEQIAAIGSVVQFEKLKPISLPSSPNELEDEEKDSVIDIPVPLPQYETPQTPQLSPVKPRLVKPLLFDEIDDLPTKKNEK